MVGVDSSSVECLGVCSQRVFMDVWLCFILGLLSDRVPPVQAITAVCAGHGSGGHAAAAGLVRSVCVCMWLQTARQNKQPQFTFLLYADIEMKQKSCVVDQTIYQV